MNDQISQDAILNSAIQLYLAFDERMGRVQPKGLPGKGDTAYRDAYAKAVAEDAVRFYRQFAIALASQLEREKPE